jgi:predicted RND superfamily exporter protein
LPAEGPARDRFERARSLFGAEEPFVVALGADDVFQPDVLERVVALSAQLEALPEIHHVVSLASAPDVVAHNGEIELRPMLERIPDSPEARTALRERTLANPLYRGALVAEDGRTVALYAYPQRIRRATCSRAASPTASRRWRAPSGVRRSRSS